MSFHNHLTRPHNFSEDIIRIKQTFFNSCASHSEHSLTNLLAQQPTTKHGVSGISERVQVWFVCVCYYVV